MRTNASAQNIKSVMPESAKTYAPHAPSSDEANAQDGAKSSAAVSMKANTMETKQMRPERLKVLHHVRLELSGEETEAAEAAGVGAEEAGVIFFCVAAAPKSEEQTKSDYL